ncbi:hypothetical protein MNZ22_11870 [Aeromonas encheleia]|uniref:hypothetical protein n=1 Tax=Aeromonas encheleia TaxID=73010 RepID=UPI001F56CBC3|nr:hypothetical protein [Aeromonas encheleia]UNP87531.1 hypothetical protein MNZ22_11870 [Aeromonas encheleia]
MKKHHHLSLIATLVLSACGGGSSESIDGSAKPTPQTTFSGRAMADSYLAGQAVCLDLNANRLCNSGEPQTTTDSQGRFTFTLPEAQNSEATQAWAIVAAPQAKQQARTLMASKATPAATLLGYFDGNGFAISPFTHQLVTSTDPVQRKTQYQSSIAAKAKLDIATELGMTIQEANAQQLFGDYLAAGDEHSSALAEAAGIKSQQIAEAAELQAQLTASLATDNPQGWTSVNVSAKKLWEFFGEWATRYHIYKQEITYSKRVGAIETTRTETTRWLLNDQGEYNSELPLQRATSAIRKDWDQKLYHELTTWESDDNQDGNATLKKVSAIQGTFSQDTNGLFSYNTTKFDNEGDPATEGLAQRSNRTFCEDFDIQAELANWATDPSHVAINQCVLFVEQHDIKESLDAQGAWVNKDTKTEWYKPDDANSWLVNAEVAPDLYLPITQIVTAQGDVQRIFMKDSQALTLNYPTLGQSPFNFTRDEQQRHNGDEVIKLAQPIYPAYDNRKLGSSISGFDKVELQSYNTTNWGTLTDWSGMPNMAYLEQDYQKQTGGFTLSNRFFQLDMTQPDGLKYPLGLKYAGNNTPFMTQDWQFDNATQTLTVKHHYSPLADIGRYEEVFPLPWEIIAEPMDLQVTIQLQQTSDLATATQITSLDGGQAVSAPTFAEGIFTSPIRWQATSPTNDPDARLLVERLFGQAPFRFTAHHDATQAWCDDALSFQQELLFAPIGGDMVVTETCGNDGYQYLLRMTEAYNGSTFKAELLEFEADNANNIYRDAPSKRTPLIFTKQ